MQKERSVNFNHQMEVSNPPNTGLDWKPGAASAGDINAFVPVALLSLNLKTPVFYEIMGNSMTEVSARQENLHTTKVKAAQLPGWNRIDAVMSDWSMLFHQVVKY